MARILAVDDIELVTGSLARALAAAGHEVVTCSTARRALEIVRGEAIDLVITDIYMPEMDGFEFLGQIRKLGEHPPVIVMSAVPEPRFDVLTMAMKLGAAGSLEKPFTVAQLLAAVESALPSRLKRTDSLLPA